VESNGWLKMSAKGFSYSSPTIKVKLTQDAPAPTPSPSASVTPTPAATATPAPAASPVAKKSTITCIKGKMTKTVTAVKPTCPTGYKKK
jgi:hypothetical protein